MKRNLLAVLIIAIAMQSVVLAQSEKENSNENNFMLGGNFIYDSHSQYLKQLATSVKFGFVLSPVSIVGIETGVDYIKKGYYLNNVIQYAESTSFTLSFFYRYQHQIKGNFSYFVEPYASKIFYKDGGVGYYNLGTDVGMLYYLSDRFSFELNITGFDYGFKSLKNSDGIANKFLIQCNFTTPNFGLKYYF